MSGLDELLLGVCSEILVFQVCGQLLADHSRYLMAEQCLCGLAEHLLAELTISSEEDDRGLRQSRCLQVVNHLVQCSSLEDQPQPVVMFTIELQHFRTMLFRLQLLEGQGQEQDYVLADMREVLRELGVHRMLVDPTCPGADEGILAAARIGIGIQDMSAESAEFPLVGRLLT